MSLVRLKPLIVLDIISNVFLPSSCSDTNTNLDMILFIFRYPHAFIIHDLNITQTINIQHTAVNDTWGILPKQKLTLIFDKYKIFRLSKINPVASVCFSNTPVVK